MRCSWAEGSKEMAEYHDTEWGVPLRDDRGLFEFLCLEGAQAGLSWNTILQKRAGYRELFHNFEIEKVSAMTDQELEQILLDKRVVRNKLKVFGVRKNALAAQNVIKEYGSLTEYIWAFTDGQPINNGYQAMEDIPAETELSNQMSKTLKQDGFTFVGSTICYAFMQATGMVNDHVMDCFRYKEVQNA
jgi:DNA-3-methyladenine glycosylase I